MTDGYIISFNLHQNSVTRVYHSTGEETSSERVSKSPKVTQLLSGGVKKRNQVCLGN